MLHIMFDIDGTLIDSYQLDSECFVAAVEAITGTDINSDWGSYPHVTDSGIVRQLYHDLDPPLSLEQFSDQVKAHFIRNLKQTIAAHPLRQIAGANAFLTTLKAHPAVSLSIATGGWLESAQLKLDAAGIDYTEIPIASANDHFSRTEIMKVAQRSIASTTEGVVYFGDGEWDRIASKQLGFRFIHINAKCDSVDTLHNYLCQQQLLSLLNVEAQ